MTNPNNKIGEFIQNYTIKGRPFLNLFFWGIVFVLIALYISLNIPIRSL